MKNNLLDQPPPGSIHFDDLPMEIINQIIYWISDTDLDLNLDPAIPTHRSKNNSSPKYVYVLNHVRCTGYYSTLVSLSSTNSFLRQKLGPILFKNISLIRINSIDSVLCNPKRSEFYSDKKKYQREFIKELLETNFQACTTEELARTSFKSHILGDATYKSRFELKFAMSNYVTYLECDNSVLRGSTLSLFPNLKALKVLDEASEDPLVGNYQIENLDYLAINARTLMNCAKMLKLLPRLKRLDLLLDYCEIPIHLGLTKIIDEFRNADKTNLTELALNLNSSFSIAYEDTITLLDVISNNSELTILSLRTKRRKYFDYPRQDQSRWPLYRSYSGDKFLLFLKSLDHLIIDIPILEVLRFHPHTYNRCPDASVEWDKMRTKTLTLVDQASIGPQFSTYSRDGAGVLFQAAQFTELNFQYGEALEEGHLHALKLVSDFVQFMVDCGGSDNRCRGYAGLKNLAIEKCWSVTDDSIRREYYCNIMLKLNALEDVTNQSTKYKLASAAVWSRTPFNSPRYRIRDVYGITYKEHRNSFDGAIPARSHRYEAVFHPKADSANNNVFWSIETSLADFEQYTVRQRKSSLWN
ncbi:uncharacterized protein SPAPADRAFT_154455 [Spathaspora passalidarum NRRL Y-27907]|uniref:F-box domain-containing protein n=1 Tax=Spathaspora passalidarum (strain NRRL Y-27907 / 11-Y1) TaxID=619300 RepID=G3AQ37_SPAPN|nr:uncharacterized protein SPAPADRAFT_154455 [Spathaspora passalidarum NRRL Y-27907]EGW31384.1 hypothetical protein SPAPADRAFT_154455 [Spathaspora passalidarum NRRL Y-27907]